MKWLIPCFAALTLVGCDTESGPSPSGQVEYDPRANVTEQVRRIVKHSVIVCADGNQVRMYSQALGTNASAFTAWTILDGNGRPKRCVRKLKNTPEAYEEVPA